MPKAFDNCRRNGGKIRTKQLSKGRYMHICILNGKSFKGEVKTKESSSDGGSPVAAAIAKRRK